VTLGCAGKVTAVGRNATTLLNCRYYNAQRCCGEQCSVAEWGTISAHVYDMFDRKVAVMNSQAVTGYPWQLCVARLLTGSWSSTAWIGSTACLLHASLRCHGCHHVSTQVTICCRNQQHHTHHFRCSRSMQANQWYTKTHMTLPTLPLHGYCKPSCAPSLVHCSRGMHLRPPRTP
jgi:hypothetical protein